MKITIGLADDHTLFLKSLSSLIDSFKNCSVIIEASNGKDLLQKLKNAETLPDIVLIDVDMPEMNGVDACQAIAERFPEIKMSALSMKDDDLTIISMIKGGCCSYLIKDIHPDELEKALSEIDEKGFYNGDASNINYRRLIRRAHEEEKMLLSEREKIFLKLACSDLTYKQIAAKMFVSERSVDSYRESLFHKFNVQSRVGMALEGVRRRIVVI